MHHQFFLCLQSPSDLPPKSSSAAASSSQVFSGAHLCSWSELISSPWFLHTGMHSSQSEHTAALMSWLVHRHAEGRVTFPREIQPYLTTVGYHIKYQLEVASCFNMKSPTVLWMISSLQIRVLRSGDKKQVQGETGNVVPSVSKVWGAVQCPWKHVILVVSVLTETEPVGHVRVHRERLILGTGSCHCGGWQVPNLQGRTAGWGLRE